MRQVLHLIPILNLGGASRAAIAAAATCSDDDEAHRIASIRPAVPRMAAEARSSGVEVLDAPERSELLQAIGAADITLVHLWNSPELNEILESDLPSSRLVVWTHVAGNTATQILAPEIFRRVHETVATSERAARWVSESTGDSSPTVIPATGGWDRIDGTARSSSSNFNIGYIGTVSFTRLHPEFVAMSLATDAPDTRFIVCGDGSAGAALRTEAAKLGGSERFDFRGQIRDIGAALSDFDLFGYPLRQDMSASSDLSVKEAMYAGVPPVVLAGTACDELVAGGETGEIAPDPRAYTRAIEELHGDPDERKRLARNAHSHAVDTWTPSKWAPTWKECFDRAMSKPARSGPVLDGPEPGVPEGATRLIRGLGEWGRDFELSLKGSASEAAAADQRIEQCDPLYAYEDHGLFDLRRRYPDDPFLALWTGLFLRGQGRPALAAGELARARRLGCDPSRLPPHHSVVGAA